MMLVLLLAVQLAGGDAAATAAAHRRRLAATGGPVLDSCPETSGGGARECRDALAFAAQADEEASQLVARRCNAPGREYGPPSCDAPAPAAGPPGGGGSSVLNSNSSSSTRPRLDPGQPVCSGKGNGDAFRHAYWSALMAFYLSPSAAAAFAARGDNDACARPQRQRGRQPLDVQMDCFNGQIGRQLGEAWSPTATPRSYPPDAERRRRRIAAAALAAAEGGRLTRLVRFGGGGGDQSDFSAAGGYQLVPTTGECVL